MASIEFSGTELCFIAACIADRMDHLDEQDAELRRIAAALGVPVEDDTILVVRPAYARIVAKLRDAMEREDLETGLVPARVLVS